MIGDRTRGADHHSTIALPGAVILVALRGPLVIVEPDQSSQTSGGPECR